MEKFVYFLTNVPVQYCSCNVVSDHNDILLLLQQICTVRRYSMTTYVYGSVISRKVVISYRVIYNNHKNNNYVVLSISQNSMPTGLKMLENRLH